MSMSMSMPEHEREPMPEYEPLPKKPRLELEAGQQSLTKEELAAHLEATEESALKEIIRDNCSRSLELCKQLSDQLYRSLLDGVALLAYLLFDKEELYSMGHSRMLYDQQNKFWEEFERFAEKGDSFYEVCKWIANTEIDWNDEYSLLNECNVAEMLMKYRNYSYRKPFVDYFDDRSLEVEKSPIDDDIGDDFYDRSVEVEKSPIDDDIEEAIKKAKQYKRLTVDEYTVLLLEIYRDDQCVKCQEFLLAKAVQCIDVKVLYGLEADAIQDLVALNIQSSAELDCLIKYDLMELISTKKMTAKYRLTKSSLTFSILLFNEFNDGELAELRYTSPPPLSVFDLIKIAELRREAEGSRFINRDHFLWAFDQRGCGLNTALKDVLASRMAAEDHPPYHIYDTVIRFARAEYVHPDVHHLAFAVIFGRFGISVEEVSEMQERLNHFKTAMCGIVNKPMDWMVSDEYLFGDYNIKDFKERLEINNGPWWDPFRD